MNIKIFCLLGLMVVTSVAAAQNSMSLSISQSPRSNLSANHIKSIVNDMNELLDENSNGVNRCQDFSFVVENIKSLEIGKDSVDTRSELDALFKNRSANVHIVRSINYCGGPAPENVVGCARNGATLVVEREIDSRTAPILWVHEFGHTQGLSGSTDRVDHTTVENSVMNSRIGKDSRRLRDVECEQLARHSRRFSSDALRVEYDVEDQEIALVQPISLLEILLDKVWLEGLPVAELKEIGPLKQVQAEIRQILLDESKIIFWENAVTALGILGEYHDIDFLKSFFERNMSLGKKADRARLQVPFAIGYISANFETAAGFAFLNNFSNPNKGLDKFATDIEEGEFLAVELAKKSLMALALSAGDSDRALGALNEANLANMTGLYNLNVDETFFSGLEDLGLSVSELGLEQYFSGSN